MKKSKMRYCALDNLGRLTRHFFVNDKKLRKGIVEEQKAQHPYLIATYQDVGNFSFQALGDTGEGDRSQYVLVDDLAAMPGQFPDTQFAMILGDVVYPDGSPKDYAERFFAPYRHYPRPIHAITGNHDWYAKLTGFKIHFIKDSGKLGAAFARPNIRQPNVYYFMETRFARIICLDSGIKGDRIDDEQFSWLNEVCQRQPQTKMKILCLHHPLYSNDKRQKIADQLEPVIQLYKISLVLTAHEHNYQKYTVRNGGFEYVQLVSGSGGAGLSDTHSLRDRKLAEDFYPSAEESDAKFKKILGLFRQPDFLVACEDNYPYYKSFLNISVREDRLEITVFKKKGFGDPLERTSFSIANPYLSSSSVNRN